MATLILSDGTRSIDFLSASGFKVPQDGIVLPVVSREDTFAEGSDSEGRSRVRSRATNSTAGQISLYLSGATASALWTTIDNLQELVESAHLNKGSISYLGPGASSTVTYDLESISVTDLPQVGIELTQLRCNATIQFESKPYGRLPTQRLNVQDTYQQMVTALSPSIFLPLGASSGLTDLSGNARNGTASGGVTVGGATGPLTVSDGGATDFDGTNDAVTTTYSAMAGERTFMGWAYRDGSGAAHSLLYGSSGSSLNIALGSGSNNVSFSPNNSTYTTWVGAWPGNAQWVHWAVTFNVTTDAVSLYINGSLVTTTTNTGAWGTANLQIGAGSPFDGKQAWVSVHQTALTATQIRDCYDAGKAQITLDGPIDSFTVESIPGQVPALPVLTLDDASTQARNIVEVGVQHDFDPDNPEDLELDLAAGLTAQGGSSNTRAGSVATNIIRAALATTPISICKAASQTHKGLWKVRARVYPSATTVLVRLAWRAGDGPFAKEKWVAVPNSAGWFDLDLGTVNIKELPSGHTCEFRIEGKSTSGSPTVDVDIVECIPADSYTKLRGSSAAEVGTGAIVAMDDFSTQTSGAVTGKTPLLAPSGTYGGAGDTDDFQVDTATQSIYRSAVSDSALNNGRYLRCGSGTLALTIASVDVSVDVVGLATQGRFGLFVRYVDTSNWLMAVITSPAGFSLIKRVAGTETVLGDYTDASGGMPFAGGCTITVSADASGNVIAYAAQRYGSGSWAFLVTGDSSLATAGALASGGYGIYDASTVSTSATRPYDNFTVSTLATSATIINPAINSGYGLDLKHNTALTDNSAGTSVGTTPIRQGNYPKLPPATRNTSKSRIVVRARRNDNDLGLADTGTSDALRASLTVTPRVHLTGT